MPLCEDEDPAALAALGKSLWHFPDTDMYFVFKELASLPEPWVRACTLYAALRSGDTRLMGVCGAGSQTEAEQQIGKLVYAAG